MIPPLFGKQEVGIWRVKTRFPRYGVPIWRFLTNIRFLPSIVAEKMRLKMGIYKRVPVKCETKSKRNETKRNKSKRNASKRNEIYRNETKSKRNKINRNETKWNNSKWNRTYFNETISWVNTRQKLNEKNRESII